MATETSGTTQPSVAAIRKTPFYRKLGGRLLLAFLGISLIPQTLSSYLSYRNAYENLEFAYEFGK